MEAAQDISTDLLTTSPGGETLELMDAFLDSPIRFIETRHEQGAAFMAEVYI